MIEDVMDDSVKLEDIGSDTLFKFECFRSTGGYDLGDEILIIILFDIEIIFILIFNGDGFRMVDLFFLKIFLQKIARRGGSFIYRRIDSQFSFSINSREGQFEQGYF